MFEHASSTPDTSSPAQSAPVAAEQVGPAPSLADLLATYGNAILARLVDHPELAVVVSVGLVAYKRNAGFRAIVAKITGKGR